MLEALVAALLVKRVLLFAAQRVVRGVILSAVSFVPYHFNVSEIYFQSSAFFFMSRSEKTI